jgi:RNA polymerase sigma factor (TIGR02999 family)
MSTSEVSLLLERWRDGDETARGRLLELVYDELHRLAQRHMRRERQLTLQPTALVHEAYLRLAGAQIPWTGRVHFFAVAANTMRRVLVDGARRRRAEKRGGGEVLLPLEEALAEDGRDAAAVSSAEDLLVIDAALEELGRLDPRKVRVLEMRLFAGLTIDETAEALELSAATVERDLKMARAWLAEALGRGRPT